MKITHFDYILECNHRANANVAGSTEKAYRKGDSIQCPKCSYKERKITKEETTVRDV